MGERQAAQRAAARPAPEPAIDTTPLGVSDDDDLPF
jgi:hypothetical protein